MTGDEGFQPRDASVSPRFADVATFMRCQRHEISADIDIGLIGVPFDLGANYRVGARHGPAGVREASRLIRRIHPTSGIKPFDICNVADLGDAPVNPLDLDASIQMIEDHFAALHAAGNVPIAVGGDHTIPTPILRAIAKDRPVGVFHVDAHADTLDEIRKVQNGTKHFAVEWRPDFGVCRVANSKNTADIQDLNRFADFEFLRQMSRVSQQRFSMPECTNDYVTLIHGSHSAAG